MKENEVVIVEETYQKIKKEMGKEDDYFKVSELVKYFNNIK